MSGLNSAVDGLGCFLKDNTPVCLHCNAGDAETRLYFLLFFMGTSTPLWDKAPWIVFWGFLFSYNFNQRLKTCVFPWQSVLICQLLSNALAGPWSTLPITNPPVRLTAEGLESHGVQYRRQALAGWIQSCFFVYVAGGEVPNKTSGVNMTVQGFSHASTDSSLPLARHKKKTNLRTYSDTSINIVTVN